MLGLPFAAHQTGKWSFCQDRWQESRRTTEFFASAMREAHPEQGVGFFSGSPSPQVRPNCAANAKTSSGLPYSFGISGSLIQRLRQILPGNLDARLLPLQRHGLLHTVV